MSCRKNQEKKAWKKAFATNGSLGAALGSVSPENGAALVEQFLKDKRVEFKGTKEPDISPQNKQACLRVLNYLYDLNPEIATRHSEFEGREAASLSDKEIEQVIQKRFSEMQPATKMAYAQLARRPDINVAISQADRARLEKKLELLKDGGAKKTTTINYELAPGNNTRFEKLPIFQEISNLPTETQYKIHEEALRTVTAKLLADMDLPPKDATFGPGGYKEYVSPSIQLRVDATDEQVDTLMNRLGYALQQNSVIGYRIGKGNEQGIIFTDETGKLDKLENLTAFWQGLRERVGDKVTGFTPTNLKGKAGLAILNLDGKWSKEDLEEIYGAIDDIADKQGLGGEIWDIDADTKFAENNWEANPNGQSYQTGENAPRDARGTDAGWDRGSIWGFVEKCVERARAKYTGLPPEPSGTTARSGEPREQPKPNQ